MWRRAMRTLRVCVKILIGAVTGKAQAACRVRWPSTSTEQMRQTPATQRSGWWQRVGILMPMRLAASRIVVPRGTFNSWWSMEMVTVPPMAVVLSGTARVWDCWLAGARREVSGRLVVMLTSSLDQAWEGIRPMISSRKCSTTERKAQGLLCPRPHLEASCMVSPRAQSSLR